MSRSTGKLKRIEKLDWLLNSLWSLWEIVNWLLRISAAASFSLFPWINDILEQECLGHRATGSLYSLMTVKVKFYLSLCTQPFVNAKNIYVLHSKFNSVHFTRNGTYLTWNSMWYASIIFDDHKWLFPISHSPLWLFRLTEIMSFGTFHLAMMWACTLTHKLCIIFLCKYF